MITRHLIIYRDSRWVLDGELYPFEWFAGAATAGVNTSGAVCWHRYCWSCCCWRRLELFAGAATSGAATTGAESTGVFAGAAVRTSRWSGDDGVLFAGLEEWRRRSVVCDDRDDWSAVYRPQEPRNLSEGP